MTKKLTDTLGLPSLEEALAAEDHEATDMEMADAGIGENYDPSATPDYSVSPAEKFINRLDDGEADHAAAMDSLYDKLLTQAEAAFDLAHNIEPNRAARMFEIAGNLMKAAGDMKNSKRDAELKALKIILDHNRQNLDAAKARADGVTGAGGPVEAEATVFMDRNELLRRLKEQPDA